MKIAFLEDDPAQAELVQSWLKSAGHACAHFGKGQPFLDVVCRETFDLLIIDWNLPDLDGPQVLTRVRERIDWPIPVLFITSRDREEDIVHALEIGADDYMTKPVNRAVLLARVAALGRRAQTGNDDKQPIDAEPFSFDLRERKVTKAGRSVELTPREYDLAVVLFRQRGRLLSRGYLLETVWGTCADLNTRTVDTHVSRVRSKLAISPADGWRLSSVYQHGYRLEQLG